jgi:6-phosphogluconolactonase
MALRRFIASLFALAFIAAAAPAAAQSANVTPDPNLGFFRDGFVFVMTNEASDNAVLRYSRNWNGQLHQEQRVSTGGLGSGGGMPDPLGSQDSLVRGDEGRFLVAVNAGSDDFTVFGICHDDLIALSRTPSGGDFPNSVAIHGDLVYVLNAHGTPNIAGFRVAEDGSVLPIPGSIQNLPGGAGSAPADLRFDAEGDQLIVTETATNQIDVFPINDNGIAGSPTTQTDAGTTPFGFKLAHHGIVVVTEADSGSVSTYQLHDDNTLSIISAAVPNGQLATCWVSLTHDRSFAYVSNTMSGTISSYHLNSSGQLGLVKAVAADLGAGGAPTDSALSRNSLFLYVLDGPQGKIAIFLAFAGHLLPIGHVDGLPTSIQGIVAR